MTDAIQQKLEQSLRDEDVRSQPRGDRMSIDWIRQAQFRPQASQDSTWLKADLQSCLSKDGLSRLWNHLVKDGELTVGDSSFYNSAGALAKKVSFPSSDGKLSNLNITVLYLATFLLTAHILPQLVYEVVTFYKPFRSRSGAFVSGIETSPKNVTLLHSKVTLMNHNSTECTRVWNLKEMSFRDAKLC
ncbi:hypothetical protein RRG08_048995 [Elysia crispata]|uniref:Uncharacterized protein n=1 Tax=Elysia crispata TaxID=231223 RepID=A0AAE0YCL4_9GAST|nr:hypothetical protein RRG08_048995 [Elysia crispata]